MDALIQHAVGLAECSHAPVSSVKSRIAYIAAHGVSYASNGYAVRTHSVASALKGHGLDVLCMVQPGRPWSLTGSGVTSVTSVGPVEEIDGVRYVHSPLGKVASDPFDMISASAATLQELFRVFRPSIVLAASDWKVGIPAWIAASRMGLPFLNEIRGFWELSEAAKNPSYTERQVFREARALDTFVAQKAQHIFTLNPPMRDELVRRGVDASKIGLVPNAVRRRETLPDAGSSEVRALRGRLGIQSSDKVIGYIGSFNEYEGLDLLLDACHRLHREGESFKLMLVGDDQPLANRLKPLSDRLVESGQDPVWLIRAGRVPHTEVQAYYALADVIVIPRKPYAVCQLVPPMKVVEALSYGKRIVVSDVNPLAHYANQYERIVACKAGDAGSLASGLMQALRSAAPTVGDEILMSNCVLPMVRTFVTLSEHPG
ncbi:glycosyltransferase [Orrella marina]|nr:glycosyltransferase [Orrella marina]